MRHLTSVLLALIAAGCQSSSPVADTDADADFVFVFLKSGPNQDLPPEEARTVAAGHFANMSRLAEEGALLVAGPLAEPRVDPSYRGVFVFDTADVAEASAWASTDPGAVAGMFVFDLLPWRAPASLRRVPTLEKALRATMDPNAGPGATVRPYGLVRCPDVGRARSALKPLFDAGKVVFFGELTAESPHGALFALDVQNAGEIGDLLETAGEVPDGFWQVHPWYASKVVADHSSAPTDP